MNTTFLCLILSFCLTPSYSQGNNGNNNGSMQKKKGFKTKNCAGNGRCQLDMEDFDIKTENESLELEILKGRNLICQRKKSKLFSKKVSSKRKREIWHGLCTGGGTANFVELDTGGLAGSVLDLDNDMVCQIRRDENLGEYDIRCQKSSEFPVEADPVQEVFLNDEGARHLMVSDNVQENSTKVHVTSTYSKLRGSSEDDPIQRRDQVANAVILDVMVLWTKASECANSGLAKGCTLNSATTNNMEILIELAISETNTAYDESGVDTQLRLVHSYRQDDYVENGFNKALSHLKDTNDGHLDDVHGERATYGADIVALIIDDPEYCGIAYLGPRKDLMFSVTAWNCATGYYSFGHEIGHNMGCNHDKGTSNACSDTNYNYGWRDPQADFRSILAYNCNSGQCDKNAGGGCTRVQRFSNPNFLYDGKPIGNAQHDNARQINDVSATVAAYFSATCTVDADCDDSNTCTTDTCNNEECINTPKSTCCGNDICEIDETEVSCPLDCGPKELMTTFSDNNRSNGNMFKIQAEKNIQVTGFDIHTESTGNVEVKVYAKEGEYTNTQSDWTLVYQGTVTGAGRGSRTSLPNLDDPIAIGEGTKKSFYILSPDSVRYTNGVQEGSVFTASSQHPDDITFYEGRGVSGEFGDQFSPRVWNGVIKYRVGDQTEQPSTSMIPSDAPSKLPTNEPSPSDVPSVLPSIIPSLEPTNEPTMLEPPTQQPSKSALPSAVPSLLPTFVPTDMPSKRPSQRPSIVPSTKPSELPSRLPSTRPSISPSMKPSNIPSYIPSDVPTKKPSTNPSQSPSFVPSMDPSVLPSMVPSKRPSYTPSMVPSNLPSITPTHVPSGVPSKAPSAIPTNIPSIVPSLAPSTPQPSMLPSVHPTKTPSYVPSFTPSREPREDPVKITFDDFENESGGSTFTTGGDKGEIKDKKSFSSGKWSAKLKKSGYIEHKEFYEVSEYGQLNVTFGFLHKFEEDSDKLSVQYITPPNNVHTVWDFPSGTYESDQWHSTSVVFEREEQVTQMKLKFLASTAGKEVYIDEIDFIGRSYSTPVPATTSPTVSSVPSNIPSQTHSLAPSLDPSRIPTLVPSLAPSGLPSKPPTEVPSVLPSIAPSMDPTKVPTESPSYFPSTVSSSKPSDSPTLTPSRLPSWVPSDIPSSVPSKFPSVVPSRLPSQSPSDVPSVLPSIIPSLEPTNEPTMLEPPTQQPSKSALPSAVPSLLPTFVPTDMPSKRPSQRPSIVPSTKPSELPSRLPSTRPSISPSMKPSNIPSYIPSDVPTKKPSTNPSQSPSFVPSMDQSVLPSMVPSKRPSYTPSMVPSNLPSITPTHVPSGVPSKAPSAIPTNIPSIVPSLAPSTPQPSMLPSVHPTKTPSYVPSFTPSREPREDPVKITFDDFENESGGSTFTTGGDKGEIKDKKSFSSGKWSAKLKKSGYIEHKEFYEVSEYGQLNVTFGFLHKFEEDSDKLSVQYITPPNAEHTTVWEFQRVSYSDKEWHSTSVVFEREEQVTQMKLKFLASTAGKEVYIDEIDFSGL